MERFVLPKLSDVFVDLDTSEDVEGDRGSPGNEGQHYKGDIQPNDLIESQGLNFAEGNIVKLVCRYRDKAGLLDLGKVVFYTYRLMLQWLKKNPNDAKLFDWVGKREKVWNKSVDVVESRAIVKLTGYSVECWDALDADTIGMSKEQAAKCIALGYVDVGDGCLWRAVSVVNRDTPVWKQDGLRVREVIDQGEIERVRKWGVVKFDKLDELEKPKEYTIRKLLGCLVEYRGEETCASDEIRVKRLIGYLIQYSTVADRYSTVMPHDLAMNCLKYDYIHTDDGFLWRPSGSVRYVNQDLGRDYLRVEPVIDQKKIRRAIELQNCKRHE